MRFLAALPLLLLARVVFALSATLSDEVGDYSLLEGRVRSTDRRGLGLAVAVGLFFTGMRIVRCEPYSAHRRISHAAFHVGVPRRWGTEGLFLRSQLYRQLRHQQIQAQEDEARAAHLAGSWR